MARAEFTELNHLSQQKGFWLFSDEVYRESEYDPSLRLPTAADINPLAISLGVVSKTYGLPGLRIGWVASQQKEILERMAVVKDYTTICSSAPGELLAEIGLNHREALAARNLAIIQSNLVLLDGFFTAHADRFSWIRPQAGSIAFPRYLAGDVEAFCHDLVTRAGVLLLPGTLFGDREDHFRIGFGRCIMPAALAALEGHLD